MASSVEQYRKLVRERSGGDGPSGKDLADVALQVYGNDYFTDPGKYEDLARQEYAASLDADDPMRLAYMASSAPDLSPDAQIAIVNAGLAGDPKFVAEMRAADQVAALEEAQRILDQNSAKHQLEMEQRQLEKSEDFWDWGPVGALKATVRTGFTALEAPFQIISNAYRAYGGYVMGTNDNSFGDNVFDIFAGTDLGAMAFSAARGWDIDTGDGWFGPSEDSRVGQFAQQRQANLWTLPNGEIATFGRSVASAVGLDKDSVAYGLISGALDLGSRVVDPSMYIGGAQVKGAAKTFSAFTKGGAEAAATARSIQDGTAIGAGLSAATGAADEAATQVDELGGLLASRDALQSQAVDAAARRDAAASASAEAVARRDAAEAQRVAAEEGAVAARTAARDQWQEAQRVAAERAEQLRAAREEVVAIQTRLNETNTRLTELDTTLKGGVDKPQPAVDNLTSRLDKDTEIQGLGIRLEMAFAEGNDEAAAEISAAIAAREAKVREEWAQSVLEVPEVRDAYLKSRGITEAGKGGRGSAEFQEFAETVEGSTYAFPKYGSFGMDVAEQPGGLSRPQSAAWNAEGVVNLAWAKREFSDAESFWSWLHTGNREAHLSLRAGERESFIDEFGNAPGWNEIAAMSRQLGKSNQKWIDVPWAASNRKYEQWASGINAESADRILAEVAADPRDFVKFVEDQRAAGAVRYSDEAAPVVRVDALRQERAELVERLKMLEQEAFAAGEFQSAVRGAARAKGGRAARAQAAAERRLAAIDDELEVLETARRYEPMAEGLRDPLKALTEAKASLRTADDNVRAAIDDVEARYAAVRDLTEQADELDARAAARAAQVEEKAAAIRASRQIPDDAADSVEGLMKYLNDEIGMLDVGDGKRLLVDNALQAIFNGKLDPILRAIANIDDPVRLAELTRGKMADPALVRALARAKTEDQVKAVFTSALANGTLAHNVGKLKVLRLYSRSVNGKPFVDQARSADALYGFVAKPLRWSVNAKERRVPWSYDIHVEDGAQMVRGTMDYISYVTKGWDKADSKALYDEWVGKMIDAPDGVARKAVAFDLMNDVLTRTLVRGKNLSDEDVDAIKQAFMVSRSAAMNKIAYNANEAAQAGRNMKVMVDGEPLEIDVKDLPMFESMLNERFSFPDPRLVRRLAKSADAIKKNGGQGNALVKVYEGIFDEFWRTAVLMRVSYIVRNVIEEQTRMALSRHPSMFTNPLAIIAMGLEGKRFGNVLSAFRIADIDATGRTFKESAEANAEANAFSNEWTRMMEDDAGGLVDVGTPRHLEKMQRNGFSVVRQGDKQFWQGAANEVLMMNTSPIARAVLAVAAGRSTKEIDDWARTRGLTREDAVVDMALNGPLAEGMQSLRVASRNSDFEAVMSTREGIKQFLFDRNSAYSYYSRWKNYTGDFRSDFIDVLWRDEFSRRADLITTGDKAGAAAQQQQRSLAQIMATTFRQQSADGNYNVLEVGVPEWVPGTTAGRWGDRVQEGTDLFYAVSGKVMKSTGVQPEQKFAYWDTIATVVAGADPKAAKEILANARESLGGINSAWAAVTLNKIEKAAAKAEGGLTVKELDAIGAREAARKTEELFYVAMKRNQVAHAMRLVFPFAQAWGNSLLAYSKLVGKNSQVIYRAGVMFDAAKGEESNVIYEALGSIPGDPLGVSMYDPEQGVIYNNASGQASIQLPGASTAVRGLFAGISALPGGGPTMAPPPMRLDTSLSSMNMLFQGGLGPGFSPMAQAGMAAVRGSAMYNALPDGLEVLDLPPIRDQVIAFQDTSNPQAGALQNLFMGLVPAPLRAAAAYAGLEFAADTEKYKQPMAAYLLQENPEKYTEGTDTLTPAGQQRLLEEAEGAAAVLNMAHSTVRFTTPGSIKPEMFLEDKDGTLLTMTQIGFTWSEYLARYDNDRGFATQRFLEDFGVGPLLSVASKFKGRGFMTDVVYDWMLANPDAKVDPSTLEMFWSGGRYSIEAARHQMRVGSGEVLTLEDQMQFVNDSMFGAASDALRRQKEAGRISDEEYAQRKSDLLEQFASVRSNEMDTAARDRRISLMGDALKQPGISETPAAEPISIYLKAREEAFDAAAARGYASRDLSAEGMSDWQQWLLELGEALLRQYPEFDDAWNTVLRGEVEEKML